MAQGTKSGVVAVVDVGSTHVACLVARVTPSADADAPNIHVTGASHVKSEGVGAAGVTDLKAAEKAIRTAIDAAEQRAGVTLERVVVALNAGKPKARLITTKLIRIGWWCGLTQGNTSSLMPMPDEVPGMMAAC
jgi:Actin-like ATPase involved in cell division